MSEKGKLKPKARTKKNLEEVRQNLAQAEASGSALQIRFWKDILAKLENKK